jgi:hypothetical protein
MSGNRLFFEGLDQLRQELRSLPQDLAGEAGHETLAAANSAAATVKREYHVVSGALRDGVTVERAERDQFGAAAIVRNTAPHAWLYDNGSQTRKWASGKSTGAMWGGVSGGSRPTHLFVSTMVRERRAMYQRLKAMLVRKGLSVSGDV